MSRRDSDGGLNAYIRRLQYPAGQRLIMAEAALRGWTPPVMPDNTAAKNQQ
ncbi:MAG: hypothetical protein LBU37_10260 [Tannerellaceae bacterium]|nr:hypothetical protein [Tannerellaceae bacterium]